MDASPWVAMSAMQKAIRRGRGELGVKTHMYVDAIFPWRAVTCTITLSRTVDLIRRTFAEMD
jgi:hypothetical protein